MVVEKIVAALGAAFILSGCVTEGSNLTQSDSTNPAEPASYTAPAEPPRDQPMFTRIDCHRSNDGPQYITDGQVNRAICEPKARAAGTAAGAVIPVGNGWANAIASGMQRGMTEYSVSMDIMKSCMAEHGYIWQTVNDFDARCTMTRDQWARAEEQEKLAKLKPHKKLAAAKPEPKEKTVAAPAKNTPND